jgi:DNA polymerase I
VLFVSDKLKIKGLSSTSAEALANVKDKHPVIEKILEYREIFRFKTTYIDALKGKIHNSTEKLHPVLEQANMETARIVTVFPDIKSSA